MGNPNVTINIGLVTTKELVYKGSFRYGVRLIHFSFLFFFLSVAARLVITPLRLPWLPKAKLT